MDPIIRTCSRLAAVLIAAGMLATPALASRGDVDTLGQYARARLADRNGAPEAAAPGYALLLEQLPDNPAVALHAYRGGLAAGDMALAARAARLLDAKGALPVEGRLLLLAEALNARDWRAARRTAQRIDEEGAFDFIVPVVSAWLDAAEGKDTGAARLDGKAGSGLSAPYDREHRALLLIAGRRSDEGLAALQALGISGTGDAEIMMRIAAASGLAANGRRDDALTLLRGEAPAIVAARAALGRRRKLAGAPGDAAAGVALLLARLAEDVRRQGAVPLALSIARIAANLDPRNDGTRLIVAGLLGETGRNASAIATFDHVDRRGLWAGAARDARLALLVAEGDAETALVSARAAAAQRGATSEDFSRLGEIEAGLGHFVEAGRSYDRAIALTERADTASAWMLWLLKGSAYEAAGDWESARPALEKAVELAPDQAVALNYLGYAQLERRENLAEAEALIRRASTLRPDDASITDSLGWAYFIRGNIPKAVETLEKAVRDQPAEPVINEHLGDAYWAAGRRIEARYAWRAALPHAEDDDAGRIRAKIEFGPTAPTARP